MSDHVAKNFYKEMLGHLTVVSNCAPDSASGLIKELAELIADYAPFVASQIGVDADDLQQIKGDDGRNGSIVSSKIPFLKNVPDNFIASLSRIFHLTRNSLKFSNEVGDAVLVSIIEKIDEIAETIGYSNPLAS